MSGPQAVRMLLMGILYPRRGTTNKERRPERQIETRRRIWRICLNTWTAQVYQPINSLCAYTAAVEFSPLYCKFVLLTDEACCHQKLGLNAGGRRYRGAHTHPRGKRKWGYVNSKNLPLPLHTMTKKQNGNKIYVCRSLCTSRWCMKPIASFLYLLSIKLWVKEKMLYELILCMNWIYIIWVTNCRRTDGLSEHEIVSLSKSSTLCNCFAPCRRPDLFR